MNKQELIEANIEWLSKYNFSYLITLHFNKIVSKQQVETTLKSFINKLNCNFFGNRSQRSLIQVPFIERNSFDNSYHVHLICEDPRDKVKSIKKKDILFFKKLIKEMWLIASPHTTIKNLKINDQNALWFKEIHDIEGACSYLLKQIKIQNYDVVDLERLNLTGIKRGKNEN